VAADVHPFAEGHQLHLAGLFWPGETGLTGHSDADVAAHAACDALFSAAGLGDLGANVGTARPEWAGASGTALLRPRRRVNPSTCSANVFDPQAALPQKNRRTVKDSSTSRPATGRSASIRRYRE
jgi:2-C-methyl-D-erythritol 2,4-cyclodiphosphate synthase